MLCAIQMSDPENLIFGPPPLANALVAANDCISLKVVALRNGAAAAGYYDESSTPDQIDKAEEFNRRRMNKLIEERGDGYSLADLCEGGVVDVAAAHAAAPPRIGGTG